jgi:hypothetical protein
MADKGRFARYMAVVFHHIGSPSSTAISQKEAITYLLRTTSDSFSGGNILAVDSAGVTSEEDADVDADVDAVADVVEFTAAPSTCLPVAVAASLALALPAIATKRM